MLWLKDQSEALSLSQFGYWTHFYVESYSNLFFFFFSIEWIQQIWRKYCLLMKNIHKVVLQNINIWEEIIVWKTNRYISLLKMALHCSTAAADCTLSLSTVLLLASIINDKGDREHSLTYRPPPPSAEHMNEREGKCVFAFECVCLCVCGVCVHRQWILDKTVWG